MRLELVLADCFKGRTRFREIVIEGPHVWYDRKLARSNVGDLLEQLEKLAPPEDPAAPSRKRQEPENPVVIDRLSMQEGTVGVRMGVGIKLPLPGIELTDIGKEHALMPVQVVRLILVNIFKGVLNVVAGAGELAVDGVKEAGSLAVDGVKGAGKAVGGVVAGIGGLFKDESSTTNAPAAKP